MERKLKNQLQHLRKFVKPLAKNLSKGAEAPFQIDLEKCLLPFTGTIIRRSMGSFDDFVAGHAELFVIEGDYIQLREGAQEILAATAALAKVAAAPPSYPSPLPFVAVTPMAQSHRLKVSSLELTSANADKTNYRF
ncbi:uncharacterized protein Fot_57719 [Forsythia ovata]|uniref:DUF7725 domain-containing protein n=1 Tax=Forsythia ovata TaxID=205694 RepID=A0ABD1NX80_9LAMI